jgi:hypothetical protein
MLAADSAPALPCGAELPAAVKLLSHTACELVSCSAPPLPALALLPVKLELLMLIDAIPEA